MASTTTDDLIEEETAKSRKSLDWAIEKGGLPREEEVNDVYTALSNAYDQIEQLLWRVEGIGELAEFTSASYPVSTEQIGLVALLAGDIESQLEAIERSVQRFHNSIGALDIVRRKQAHLDRKRGPAVNG